MLSVNKRKFSIFTELSRWFERRNAIREMYKLPNYLLDDIGVSRDEIPALVDGLIQRKSHWIDTPANSSTQIYASSQRHAV